MTLHDAQNDEDAPVISTPVGSRRRFFAWVTRIAMGVIGVGWSVPLIGYVVPPAMKRRESSWNELGPIILGLLLLPFLDRNPERRPSSRPVAVLAGTVFLVTIFTLLGISIRDLQALPKFDPSVARGESLFAQNHCIACHGLHGEGGKVGPDLSYVGNRRPDRDWHIRHLQDPASVSPGSIMPKFPLSDREMNDLASYLLSLKGAAAAPTEEALETDETEYALLPYVGVTVLCQASVEAEERKEQI